MEFKTVEEIAEYAATLKGAELSRVAADLDIPGRSKLKAADLRNAVRDALTANLPAPTENSAPILTDARAVVNAITDGLSAASQPDVWHVVPNRRDKRHARKHRHHLPTQRRSQEESDERKIASIVAGERGRHYGNRDHLATLNRDGEVTHAARFALRINTRPAVVPSV